MRIRRPPYFEGNISTSGRVQAAFPLTCWSRRLWCLDDPPPPIGEQPNQNVVYLYLATCSRSTNPVFSRPFRPTEPGQRRLRLGATSIGCGVSDGWGRNDVFCVAVSHVTRTAGI